MNHNQMNMHVPMNPVGPAPNVPMQMQVPGPIMQQQSPQQIQPAMPQQAQQDKMDNISKVKTLMGSLRESIPVCTRLIMSFKLFLFRVYQLISIKRENINYLPT
jgi:hypothetical protein